VIECNQIEGPGGLSCMQRCCRMHVDEDYRQEQAQVGVDPGPECRHCTAYVLRDTFVRLDALSAQMNE
jgi:hypothetical protein